MPTAKKQPWRCKARDPETNKRCTRKAKLDGKGWCGTCAKRIAPAGPKTEEGKRRIAEHTGARSFKHGLYARDWTPEENDLGLEIQQKRGTLHDELDDCRVMLLRINAYLAQRDALTKPNASLTPEQRQQQLQSLQQQFEDVEVRSEVEGTIITGADGQQRIQYSGTPKRTSVRQQMSLEALMNMKGRYLRQLADLEIKAKELGAGRGGDPREMARKIQQAFKEMQESNDVASPYV